MHSIRGHTGEHSIGRSRSAGICIGALVFFAVLVVSGAAPEKHLSVFYTAANYSLPIVQRRAMIMLACSNYSIPSER